MALKEKNELIFHQFNGLKILLRQFNNPLLLVLTACILISYYFGERTNSFVILIMMVISIVLGFWNEYGAEKTVSDLLKKISLTAIVIRKGNKIEIPIRDIVIGDTVIISAGTIIPADIDITQTFNLEVDESVVTGESMPVHKNTGDTAFMGTVVSAGNAQGLVTTIGRHTRFGQISKDLSVPRPTTEFQKGLTKFSLLLVQIIAIMSVVIFLVNFLLGHPPIESLLFSLAIAIGLTPELFPVIITVSLAAGSRRMAKKQIVTKQLVAIEDLGNMDVFCTDKTGTLTQGAITLNQYFDINDKSSNHILDFAMLCNTSGPHDKISVNNIDTAIWTYANKHLYLLPKAYKQIFISQFDFEHRAMFAVVKNKSFFHYILKGSPEEVISACQISQSEKKKALHHFELLSNQGIRVIAVASKKIPSKKDYSFADANHLHFEGFLTFSDIPKPNISSSLDLLEKLQVSIKVITGDNELVTQNICQQVGVPYQHFLLGKDIDKMSEELLIEAVKTTDFFARVSPEQKVRIIQAIKRNGHTVGFLGDGINDAPALHSADVGISVNTAVDVAKDAASIVMLNKDISVLANGIIEGRKIFANTIKYILMGTSSNFGNMFSAATASFMLPFLPMTASQILLTNFLYDISQIAIPTDNVDPETLQKPEKWDIGIIKKYMLTFGPASSLFDFATFGMMLFVFHANESLFQTGWFVESLITEILVIFMIRTRRIPFFTSKPGTILTISSLLIVITGVLIIYSPLASYFGFVQLPTLYFSILVLFTLVYLGIVESIKYFSKII